MGRPLRQHEAAGGGGRLLHGLSYVPFAPVPVWDVTRAGTILSSSGAEYPLIETGMNGDTLRVIRGPTGEAVENPAAEREDSARALAARLDCELRRRVVLRAPLTREPPPFFGANYIAGVIREADTDVDRVARFTVSAETDSRRSADVVEREPRVRTFQKDR